MLDFFVAVIILGKAFLLGKGLLLVQVLNPYHLFLENFRGNSERFNC